jgi:hypothetical protein
MFKHFGHLPRRRAFTLVEAVATMVVLGAMGSVAASIIVNCARGYSSAVTRAELASDGSAAMDRAWRNLMEIPLKSSYGSVAPDISSLTATSVDWSPGYTLALSGTDLRLTEPGGTARMLLANVSALSIRAYDENGTALAASLSGAACDPIRRIAIQFTIGRSGSNESFRTHVFLRAAMSGAG